jgi:hypothetical protein
LIKVRVLIKIIEQNYDKAIYPNKIYWSPSYTWDLKAILSIHMIVA